MITVVSPFLMLSAVVVTVRIAVQEDRPNKMPSAVASAPIKYTNAFFHVVFIIIYIFVG